MDKVYVVSSFMETEPFSAKIFSTEQLAKEYISLNKELKIDGYSVLEYIEVEILQDNNELYEIKNEIEKYKNFKGFEVGVSRKGITYCKEYNIEDHFDFSLCLYETFRSSHSNKFVLCLARDEKEAKDIALKKYKEKNNVTKKSLY